MIVTCNRCPRQLCFVGIRDAVLRLFGWSTTSGRHYCPACAEQR